MKDLEARMSEVRRKISLGELPEAESILRELAPCYPLDARIHSQLGIIAYRRKDNFAAMASLAQAIQLDPGLLEARITQVKVALRQNQNRVACDLAEQLLKVDRTDPRIVEVASRAFARVKNYSRAAEEWSALAELRPTDAGPLIEAAGFFLKAGALEQAAAYADKAGARDPTSAEPLAIKAAVFDATRDSAGFAGAIRQLAAIDPARALAFLPNIMAAGSIEVAADVLLKAKAHAVAIDAAAAAPVIKALARQAKTAQEALDGAKAAALWTSLLALDPENEAAKSGLRKIVRPLIDTARDASDHGNFEQAYAWFREAIAIEPADGKLWREYAKAASAVGAWMEAAKAWLRFDDLAGPDAETVLRACKQASKARELDQALLLLVEARRRFPDEPQIVSMGDSIVKKVVAEARIDVDAGRIDEAAAAAELVSRWEEGSIAADRILGKARTALSAIFKDAKAVGGPAAVSAAQRLIRLSPNRTDALNVLADHYYDQRQFGVAAEHYTLLTQMEPDKERHWIRLLKSRAAANDYEKGVPIALTILGKYPENASARQILGELLRQQTVKTP